MGDTELSIETRARDQGVLWPLHRSEVEGFPKADRPTFVRRIAQQMKHLTRLQDILEAFSLADIRALSFKGPALSELVYGDAFFREYGDFDIIVHPRDVFAACDCLRTLGFQTTYPKIDSTSKRVAVQRFHKAQTLQDTNGITTDLHWHLLSQWVAFEIPFEELWDQRQILNLSDICRCDVFSNVHSIIFLAFHGSQDGWTKLKPLLDLALSLNNLEYDAAELYSIVGPRRPLLDRALSLAIDLLGATPPRGHRPFFQSQTDALEFLSRAQKANEPPQLALLAPNLWEGQPFVALCRSLKAVITPSVEDIESVELPEWAINSYYLVRLVRLLNKSLERRRFK